MSKKSGLEGALRNAITDLAQASSAYINPGTTYESLESRLMLIDTLAEVRAAGARQIANALLTQMFDRLVQSANDAANRIQSSVP